MSRKFFLLLLILTIPIILTSCTIKLGDYTFNNFQVTKKKPAVSYYTDELLKNLNSHSTLKVVVLDTNLYKEVKLSSEDLDTMKSFFNSLKKSNYIESIKDLPSKPVFKLFITTDKDKYVVDIYSEKHITLHPWDGDYSVDYINTNNVQPIYNLFGLCKYLMPK